MRRGQAVPRIVGRRAPAPAPSLYYHCHNCPPLGIPPPPPRFPLYHPSSQGACSSADTPAAPCEGPPILSLSCTLPPPIPLRLPPRQPPPIFERERFMPPPLPPKTHAPSLSLSHTPTVGTFPSLTAHRTTANPAHHTHVNTLSRAARPQSPRRPSFSLKARSRQSFHSCCAAGPASSPALLTAPCRALLHAARRVPRLCGARCRPPSLFIYSCSTRCLDCVNV